MRTIQICADLHEHTWGFAWIEFSFINDKLRLVYDKANTTAHQQPCDAGIIRSFKSRYRSCFALILIELKQLTMHG